MSDLTIFHKDHGITDSQWAFIEPIVKTRKPKKLPNGADHWVIEIPAELGTVPCGLYGPVMGDDPVTDDQVRLESRNDRPWKDRLINAPMRPVGFVQVIGLIEKGLVFTCYGGPLAPQNPDDPSNHDPDAARAFWAKHALVG